ncbi:polysaccharide pyruvyl transferase family protein [Methylovulum psychrotolerans]|uniref:polysaccharide pyruvyl transferase family protein n=1 Tax=Methylovulum psychrotolerans TaxID=1704499 RepID=UPI001475F84D|nr:polysaccharide pyruvyl transferase family protein [Methylovulum psychrotolerans]
MYTIKEIKAFVRFCEKSISYRVGRLPSQCRASILGNGIHAFWFRREVNFGDLITPLILNKYGYTPIYTQPNKARLIATGSILEFLTEDYSGLIVGSGFISKGDNRQFPHAKILSVRGELTRKRLSLPADIALGDSGLIASDLMPKRQSKQYVLGIVAHYAEKNDAVYLKLRANLGDAVLFIDPQNQPLKVFDEIDRCENILSSSLHGLIAADSMGIPNRWLSSTKLVGGEFKFHDYYSSIEFYDTPITLLGNESLHELIAQVKPKRYDIIQRRKDSILNIWGNIGAYI